MLQSDARLLAEAREGNEASFLALYHRHRTPLYRFAWRLTGSEATAEDVTQDCFVALLEGAGFREQAGSLRAYLFGVSRHLAYRRARLSDREESELDTEAAPQQLDAVLAAERSEAVTQAMAALPALQREAVILFEYEDLSLEEISQVTGVEVGAVKARLHRARETLRRRLAPLLDNRPTRRWS